MSTILIISPEPWDGHFVSKHHYARELARRGHNVLFHGPPDTTGGLQLASVANDVQVLYAPRVVLGLRFLPAPLRQTLEARWLRQVEQVLGRPIDVVWNFENSRFFDMSFAGHRLKIYQQVDLDQNFHPVQAAMSADVALVLNAPIKNRLSALGADKPIHIVSHGLSVANEIVAVPDVPIDWINAAYIGNLGMRYLDVEAFSEVVRQHSARVLFHLFGSFDDATPLRQALEGQKNVIWYGWQNPQAVYRQLSAMDISMVLYRTQMNPEQLSNSHKILEYLHSGAVVASSFLLDYKDRPDLIEMAPLEGSYPDLFASVLARLDVLNTPEQRQKRKAYSLEHTYAKKLDQIEAIIAAQCSGASLNARPLTMDET